MVKYETEREIQKLGRERDLMLQEVVQVRQEHDLTLQQIDALNQQMQSAESRQKQMVSLLAKVLQSATSLGNLKNLKERREIVSKRVRKKSLKQHQSSQSESEDKVMDQQILKCRLDSSVCLLPEPEQGEDSASPMVVCDRGESRRLHDDLLQDTVDKFDFDIGGQHYFIGSAKSVGLEGNNRMSSQTDSTGYLVSFPDNIASRTLVLDDNPPPSEDMARPNLETDALKGKNGMNFETDAAAAATEYLAAFPYDISQEVMFQDGIALANDLFEDETFWNVGVDSGGSSVSCGHESWENLGDAQEMEAASGCCSLWGLGLHTLEEDFDIDQVCGW